MTKEEIIRILQAHEQPLRQQYGVKSLALFGSVVRGQATESSDVDLLIEFDDRPVGLLHLIGTEQHIARLLGVTHVDLVLRRAVIPELKDNILGEAIDVFLHP
jgi:uncharacterized protein